MMVRERGYGSIRVSWHNTEFTFHGRWASTLVFKCREALDATDEILGDNGIRRQCSPDIAPVWNGGKKKAK